MAVNADFLGRRFALPTAFEVTGPALRAFADAVGASHPACRDAGALGHPDIVAAPTFAVVVAQAAEALYIADPDAGIDFSRVVHASERFIHHRPIVAGDRLDAVAHVEAIASRAGLTQVTTRTELTLASSAGPMDDAAAHRPAEAAPAVAGDGLAASPLGPADSASPTGGAGAVATVWSTLAVREEGP